MAKMMISIIPSQKSGAAIAAADVAVTLRSRADCGFVPAISPSGNPRDRHAECADRHAERHRKSVGDLRTDVLGLVVPRVAHIAVDDAGEPVPVLRQRSPRSSQNWCCMASTAALRSRVGPKMFAPDPPGRAASCEDDERDDQQERNQGQQPPEDEPEQLILAPRVYSAAVTC